MGRSEKIIEHNEPMINQGRSQGICSQVAWARQAREPETPTRLERRPVTSVKGDGEQRLTRHRIEKTLSHSKAIQARTPRWIVVIVVCDGGIMWEYVG